MVLALLAIWAIGYPQATGTPPLPTPNYGPKSAIQVQEAKVDITPPEPLPLGGYTARHDRVMDPGGEKLFARCLLFTAEKGPRIAIVSAEMLTIPDSLYSEVRRRVDPGITLFLCATHTHSAPDSQMLNDHMTFHVPGVASYRHRWLAWYVDKIA